MITTLPLWHRRNAGFSRTHEQRRLVEVS